VAQPYVPHELPLNTLEWVRYIPLMGEANRQIARYAGMLDAVPNPDIFLAPLTLQEAVFSSRIEGTEETFEDVLRFEADVSTPPEKLAGIQEIINYRAALEYAVVEMQTRPLNLNLIKQMHAVLMDSARGKNKGRGEFRRSQVYIGVRGGGIESASYIPPAPEHVMSALDQWEKYIHFEEADRLVQLAIVHAQFEIIHPFLDGNGRIGRIRTADNTLVLHQRLP
jgi:Fic family protein